MGEILLADHSFDSLEPEKKLEISAASIKARLVSHIRETCSVKQLTACDFVTTLIKHAKPGHQLNLNLCRLITDLLDLIDLQHCFKLLFDANLAAVVTLLIESFELKDDEEETFELLLREALRTSVLKEQLAYSLMLAKRFPWNLFKQHAQLVPTLVEQMR